MEEAKAAITEIKTWGQHTREMNHTEEGGVVSILSVGAQEKKEADFQNARDKESYEHTKFHGEYRNARWESAEVLQ